MAQFRYIYSFILDVCRGRNAPHPRSQRYTMSAEASANMDQPALDKGFEHSWRVKADAEDITQRVGQRGNYCIHSVTVMHRRSHWWGMHSDDIHTCPSQATLGDASHRCESSKQGRARPLRSPGEGWLIHKPPTLWMYRTSTACPLSNDEEPNFALHGRSAAAGYSDSINIKRRALTAC